MKSRNTLIFSLFLFISMLGNAQFGGDFDLLPPKERIVTIPASPEVAQFEKYGNFANNFYTGTPEISIPVFNHKGKEISLPVSLTYDASGVKVNQYATNVGLSWNLSFGGVVSRRTNHLPDDLIRETGMGNGSQYTKIYQSDARNFINEFYDKQVNFLIGDFNNVPGINTGAEAHALATKVWNFYYNYYRKNEIDSEPDTFPYNVNGISGTIVVDYDTPIDNGYKAYCTKNPDFKIKGVWVNSPYGNTLKYINKWEITDNQGTTYIFERKERADILIDETDYHIQREYVTAWYMTELRSTNNFDNYTFHYSPDVNFDDQELLTDQNKYAYRMFSSCGTQPDPAIISNSYGTLNNKLWQFHLDAIKYNNNIIFSTEVAGREDNPVKKRYTGFKIFNIRDQLIERIDLHQSYFKNTSGQTQNDIYNSRLKLDGITIYKQNYLKGKKYAFTYYNEFEMPKTNSNSVDFWGYNNGKFNATMIAYHQSGLMADAANRTSDFNFAIFGTMKSIYYPTGGKTTFYYEPHKLVGAGSNHIIGGLRLRKQVSHTLDSNFSEKVTKIYFYNDLKEIFPNNPPTSPSSIPPQELYTSSGMDQQPLTFFDTKLGSNQIHAPNGECEYFTTTTLFQFSQNKAQIAPNSVTYSKVSEIEFNGQDFNGYTLYSFHNEDYNVSGDSQDVPYFDTAPLNGKLIEKSVYDKSFQIVNKVENSYNLLALDNNGNNSKGFIPIEGLAHAMMCVNKGKPSSQEWVGKIVLIPPTTLCSDTNGDGTPNCFYDVCNLNLPGRDFLYRGPINEYFFYSYNYPKFYTQLITETQTNYFNGNAVTTTTNYNYTSPYHYYTNEVEKIVTSGSGEEIILTHILYPKDLTNTNPPEVDYQNLVTNLVDKNNISIPLKITSYQNGTLVGVQRKFYKTQVNLPSHISVAKANLDMEDKVTYKQYDPFGNPVVVLFNDVANTYYIWGYSGQLLLGQIRGLPVPQQGAPLIPTIALNKINEIITESNGNNSSAVIRDKFDELRTLLPDSEITGYTHLPGIGISTVIDPKGDFISYSYDLNNRLEKTKDKNEKILTENAYHYRDLIINDDDAPESIPFAFSITAQNNFNNTFTFTAEKIYGESNNFTLNWSLLNEETTITGVNTQNQYQYIVEYECPEFIYFTSNIVVRCDITDNTTGITITQFSNKLYSCPRPLSATALVVQEVRELNPNNGQTEFLGLDFTITDFEGGTEGGVEFEWFYKLGIGDYSPIPNDDMTEGGNPSTIENNFLIQGSPTMNIICNNPGTVQFKCVIRDTMSSIDTLTLVTDSMNISCSNNEQ